MIMVRHVPICLFTVNCQATGTVLRNWQDQFLSSIMQQWKLETGSMPHVQMWDNTDPGVDSIQCRMPDGRMPDGRMTDGRMLSRSCKLH